ncbi:hypothetical protein BGW38_001437 [Lunasporangiospora selenospora]|uniref:Glutathione S-transferase n=1 Tax=Lunasporangiospora selenospora TaxID=979761 RepID=A0A9P6FTF4_9FUNG|nr:hypothetical protein BGW38_001437 [Lunasporangiospora selenospora]
MSEQEDQIISSTSEPVVEIVEEVQPDGSIIRKKKTTRVVTKRVLSSKPAETRTVSTTSTTSSNSTTSGEAVVVSSGSSSTESISSSQHTHTEESQQARQIELAEQEHHQHRETVAATVVTESIKVESTSEVKATNVSVKEETKGSSKIKLSISHDHPFFRFLSLFPLKTNPAPHTRPALVKPLVYAYAPGWQTKKAADGKEDEKETGQHSPTSGSFDVDSLKWMAYLKFNNIEYDVRPAFEPNMSPNGRLPFLALPNGSFVTSDDFEGWVQENKPADTGNSKLNHHEAAEAVAFAALAESKIHAALMYTLWFESTHFQITTRDHYFGHYNRFLQPVLAYREKSTIVDSMLQTRSQIEREQIFEEASAAIEALSVQLGDSQEYFFGKSQPSSLDAIVFSYLHVILTMPRLPSVDDGGRSSELARIVRKHSNLYLYAQRTWKTWFA